MIAIRGATSVEADTPEEIRQAVGELMRAICEQNSIAEEDIVCILLSNTADIRSLYPAKAAREAGFARAALFSAAEPDICGALPLCIRVMILAEKDIRPRHVYLRRAAALRRDRARFSVALDGPSGSGKSTAAKQLAKELDILYLDTGAMYRACAVKAQRAGVTEFTEESVAPLMASLDLRVDYVGGAQRTILDGEDVSEAIRRPEVSLAASRISALRCVRKKMVEMQRKIASERSCVLDGRDIGTVVLPAADFKFFITASVDVRAKRRYDELKGKGFDVQFDAVRREIEERDRGDETRAFSPLRRADDALLVDTSGMTAEEVVVFLKKKIQERV